jgi:DNA-binding HxlR family transcriptional regulator
MRFGVLKCEMLDITQKMLTQQLRDLEAAVLIHREGFVQIPPRPNTQLRISDAHSRP